MKRSKIYDSNLRHLILLIFGLSFSILIVVFSILAIVVILTHAPEDSNLLTIAITILTIFIAVIIALTPLYAVKIKKHGENVESIVEIEKSNDELKIQTEGLKGISYYGDGARTFSAIKSLFDWSFSRSAKIRTIREQKEFDDVEANYPIPQDVLRLFEKLYDSAGIIIRTGHTLNLKLSDFEFEGKPAIKIKGTLKYTIKNPSKTTRLPISFKLVSELGMQSIGEGGFESAKITIDARIKEITPEEFKAKKREPYVYEEILEPMQSIKFEFRTFGIFNINDRFVWYSQDFCDNCELTVKNETKFDRLIHYKVYHHRKPLVESGIIYNDPDKYGADSISFKQQRIYPYEGLAMFWDYTD